jgi:hypothetical protein
MAQQINLYDPSLERKRDWLALGNMVGLAAFLAVAVGAAGYLARLDLPALNAQATANESQLKAARDQIAALGQQAASRKPDPRVEQEVAAKRMLLAARGEVLATLRQSLGPEAGGSFADYLQGFARQTVSGLWLTAFAIDAMSGGMEIRGRTVDPALLPEYIRRLNKETAFQGREFAALKLDTGKPDTPAAQAMSAVARAPYHEFMLIPAKTDAAAKLTRAAPAGTGGTG